MKLSDRDMVRVYNMRADGMTPASEYSAARRHLRAARKAKETLALMKPDAYGRSHYSAEIVHQLACAMGARGRARLLRRVCS